MPGQRAAPWSAPSANFRAVPAALPALPDEGHLTPTRLPTFRPRLVSAPHFTVTPSADIEPGTRFTRVRCALRSLLSPNSNQTAMFRLRLRATEVLSW
jgi:hypothetical protein